MREPSELAIDFFKLMMDYADQKEVDVAQEDMLLIEIAVNAQVSYVLRNMKSERSASSKAQQDYVDMLGGDSFNPTSPQEQ